ncbi:hypothetical protein DPEC_G00002910 [Dallia pectoralis]|uniref:Uncharacterized protein n=1 Tax=Dallia pectoralis TaxID=75939 RepID=A0ACC2HJ39_DALPE|nr:hypothetical protein DPEC_G00002910 [Dallia pectoralis]
MFPDPSMRPSWPMCRTFVLLITANPPSGASLAPGLPSKPPPPPLGFELSPTTYLVLRWPSTGSRAPEGPCISTAGTLYGLSLTGALQKWRMEESVSPFDRGGSAIYHIS